MQSSQGYLRSLYFVYWSMFLFQFILLCVDIWILEIERDDDYDLHYMIVDLVFMVVCFSFSFFIPNRILKSAKKKRGMKEKLTTYRKAIFIRWTFLLIASIFSIVCFIMTKEYIFVCSTIFSTVVFILNRTGISIISEHLDLSNSERRILENPNSVI